MEYSTDEGDFVFPFKEEEASQIRNKAKTIYRKTTALERLSE